MFRRDFKAVSRQKFKLLSPQSFRNKILLTAKSEEKVLRQLWRLGKINEIHKGRDGKVRSATIKTST
ncbi:hypothetical protein TNCV_2715491, partial [Trichonephila clavipes]